MNVLNKMISEVTNETFLTESNFTKIPPRNIAKVLTAIIDEDPFLYALYSKHTYWDPSSNKTAGVMPHPNGNDIIFIYNKPWLEGLSSAEVLFLLIHEIGHIVREHHARELQMTKSLGKKVNHHIMNIAMDTWINEDIKQGKSGRFTTKPPVECFSFSNGDRYGSVVKWVNDAVKEWTGQNMNFKYDGPDSTEPLYEWIMEIFDKYQPKPPKQEKTIQVGDIIAGPDGKTFGQVISVDEITKKVTKVESLSKAEAFERVRIRDGSMPPRPTQNSSGSTITLPATVANSPGGKKTKTLPLKGAKK